LTGGAVFWFDKLMDHNFFTFKKPRKSFLKLTAVITSCLIILAAGIASLIPTETFAQASSSFWNLEKDAGNNLNFYFTNAGSPQSPAMQIGSNGRVGIGTTAPTTKLQVTGGSISIPIGQLYANHDPSSQINSIMPYNAADGQMIFSTYYGSSTAGGYLFKTLSSGTPINAMEIQGDGKVGIGTTAPTANLHVVGGCGNAGCRNFKVNYAAGGILANTELSGLTFPSDDLGLNAWTALYAKQGGASYAGVFNGISYFYGNVGIRAGVPVNDLHIKQSVNSNVGGGIRLEKSDSAIYGAVYIGDNSNLFLMSNSSGHYCQVGPTSMACSSDRRLKENIAPLGGSALDIIDRLKPSTFNMKNNGAHTAGFIAQDVKEVLSEAVSFDKEMGYYSLSDGYFTPYIVKGVQELNTTTKALSKQEKNQQLEIDLLKKEIEELKKLR
jgi:hypothetical protein